MVVPRRNCMTNLLTALEKWTRIIDEGGSLDLIYTDFAKAFDSVPHVRLLLKLNSLGIGGEVLAWIKAFLSNRKQRVAIEVESSPWTTVGSGIPQGSVLGPTLFAVFINDMPSYISSCCKMFADDAKIYRAVNCIEDARTLQMDVDNMVQWSKKWQLPFNVKKCTCIHFGPANLKQVYTMGNHKLETVTEEKDHGVIIDDALKFHKQTAASIKKANNILGVMKRTFVELDLRTLPLIYKSMVRPHLEYGNVIWGPHYKGDQQGIEKVQRRATKLIPTIQHLPYNQRLRILNLPSLQYRRRRGDILQVFKIVTNKVNINMHDFFQFNKSHTRGHQYKFLKLKSNKLVKDHCLSRRTFNDWNSLPLTIVQAETVNDFKNKLDKHWKDQQYEIPF